MAKTYQNCIYHGRFEVREEDDFQCPKCAKEIYDFGQFMSESKTANKTLTNDAKNLMKRAGVKF